MPILLLFRVLQGAGGGGLQPMAQAIMADSFEPQKRGQAFALYGLVAVLAPSIGPTLGGWITDNFSWRWIFYINIPVGILAFILVTRLVDDPPWIKPDRSRLFNMDYLGLAFLTIAMGGMQIMLDKGEENDWFSSGFIRFFAFLFVSGMVALVCGSGTPTRPAHQPQASSAIKNFAICCFLMMLVGGVLNANTVLQPAVHAAAAWLDGHHRRPGAHRRRHSRWCSSCPWPALPPANSPRGPWPSAASPCSFHLPLCGRRSPR